MYKVIPVERVKRPTADEFGHLTASGKPFVIERGAEHWKALAAWTPDYLLARAGEAQVPVLKVLEGEPDGRFFYGGDTADTVKFGDCLPLLGGASARFYMAGVSIAPYLPMLAEDLGRFDFVEEKKQRRNQIWISGRNSKGPLHFDLDDNIHVVVSGRKRFLMFDYSQSRNLYPCPAFSATPHYCLFDAQESASDRFPRARLAEGYDVTLGSGEMVYIPQGCWHQVLTEEPSVAVNFWLGKKYFDRPMWRILANLSVRAVLAAVTAPWRLLTAPRRTITAPR